MSYKKIQVTIDLNKIDASRAFIGKNGARYYTMVLWPNDTPDQYGNDFAVKPKSSKADVENKVKLPYIGNAKVMETPVAQSREEAAAYGRQQQQRRHPTPAQNNSVDDGTDVPF